MKLDPGVVEALAEIERERGIEQERLVELLKEAFVAAWRKENGEDKEIQIEINLAARPPVVEGYIEKEVVEEVTDPSTQVSLADAREKVGEEAEVGDIVLVEVDLEDFGLLAVDYFRHQLQELLREEERGRVYEQFKDRVFEVFNVKVLYRDRGDVYVEVEEKYEGIIPRREQIPTERYDNGTRLKALLIEVQPNRSPMLVFSRAHPKLIEKLFEHEVPEVAEGNIEIVAIARDPGHRAKVAVRSKIPEIDPVGTCIGTKGIRVTAVSSEIANEKIDLIEWKDDPFELIAESLSPAKVYSVEIFEDTNRAEVIVPDDQIAIAIGRGWRNVKLASRITGYHIEVKSMSEAGLTPEEEEEEGEGDADSGEQAAEASASGEERETSAQEVEGG